MYLIPIHIFLLLELPSCLDAYGHIDLNRLEMLLVASDYAHWYNPRPFFFSVRGFERCRLFFNAEDRETHRQRIIASQKDISEFDANAFVPGDSTFDEAMDALSVDLKLYGEIVIGIAKNDPENWRNKLKLEEKLWALIQGGGEYAPIPWFTSGFGPNAKEHKVLQLQLPDKIWPFPLQTFVEVKCFHNPGLDPTRNDLERIRCCPYCGKLFQTNAHGIKAIFCSSRCRVMHQRKMGKKTDSDLT